ncbi:uncharacterized protein V6R79_008617 [Siganus canaliculatus]
MSPVSRNHGGEPDPRRYLVRKVKHSGKVQRVRHFGTFGCFLFPVWNKSPRPQQRDGEAQSTFTSFTSFTSFISFISFISFTTFITVFTVFTFITVFSFISFITFITVMILLVIVLSSCLTPALCCDWLRYYGRHSNASMILVNDMGGPLTEQKSPVSFPYNMYRRIRNNTVESQLLFTRDSLKLILSLYRHDNLSTIDWDPFHREHFLQALHRQMDGLNACRRTSEPQEPPAARGEPEENQRRTRGEPEGEPEENQKENQRRTRGEPEGEPEENQRSSGEMT